MVNGNNHPPQFNRTDESQVVAVPHNLEQGVKIIQLQASDPDANDGLTYSVVGGNGSAYFAVDPATGQLTVFDSELSRQEVRTTTTQSLKPYAVKMSQTIAHVIDTKFGHRK